MEANPELTAGWDVVFDARGHLAEPHTRQRIDLGTISVRRYVATWSSTCPEEVPRLRIAHTCPTVGPDCRYRFALFVEKEGFNPLLVSVGIAERFDIAIMSTKGMSVTAARQLVEHLSARGVTILVLHEFDKTGFSILHTLRTDTRRYQFRETPRVVDLGLRLEDVRAMGLQAEEVFYRKCRSDPRIRLRECGATEAECDFLVHRKTPGLPWEGERVELNAMTAAQFIDFLESKLRGAGVTKVVPNARTLATAFRRATATALVERGLDEIVAGAQAAAQTAKVPKDLTQQVKAILEERPALPWDTAVAGLAITAVTNERGQGKAP
jgi:hypothetical protein